MSIGTSNEIAGDVVVRQIEPLPPPAVVTKLSTSPPPTSQLVIGEKSRVATDAACRPTAVQQPGRQPVSTTSVTTIFPGGVPTLSYGVPYYGGEITWNDCLTNQKDITGGGIISGMLSGLIPLPFPPGVFVGIQDYEPDPIPWYQNNPSVLTGPVTFVNPSLADPTGATVPAASSETFPTFRRSRPTS